MDPNLLVILIAAAVVVASFTINDVRRYIARKVKIAYGMGMAAGANAARMFDAMTQPEVITQHVHLQREGSLLQLQVRAISAGELKFLGRTSGGASVSELVSMALVVPEMTEGQVRRHLTAHEQQELANVVFELSGLTMDQSRA